MMLDTAERHPHKINKAQAKNTLTIVYLTLNITKLCTACIYCNNVASMTIRAASMLRKRQLMPKTITLDVLRLTRSGYCPTAKLITVGELFDFKKITIRVALTHFLTAGKVEVDSSS